MIYELLHTTLESPEIATVSRAVLKTLPWCSYTGNIYKMKNNKRKIQLLK